MRKTLSILALLALLNHCAQTAPGEPTALPAAQVSDSCTLLSYEHRGYYYGLNTCQSDNAFKLALHNRIKDHRVLMYRENSSPLPTGYNFAYIGDSLAYLDNYSLPVPQRFDVWDVYIAYAIKRINPLITTCGRRQITEWYRSTCRNVPASSAGVPQLFLDSGDIGDQDPGSGSNKYNREHSWPKSWFAAGATPVNNPAAGSYCFDGNNDSSINNFAANNWDYRAYTDIVHLIPTDRDTNTVRSDNPYGIVSGAGSCPACSPSKSGSPDYAAITNGMFPTPGTAEGQVPSGLTVFEPPDGIKGDMARIYFYMATRYYQEDTCWKDVPAAYKANIKRWQENMLRRWHQDDPVDDVERARNDLIHRVQGNRNPFVDHPEWVDKISDF
jgi:endonuclease I